MSQNRLIEEARAMLEEAQSVPIIPIEERPSIPIELQQETVIDVVDESKPVQGTISQAISQVPAIPMSSSEIVAREAVDGQVMTYEPPPPPTNANQYQKFGDLPAHLRDNQAFDLFEIRKLNLAVAVEALERATSAHENYPSPDAGMAVSQLSDQVHKLVKDMEKAKDPKLILDDILDNALSHLTRDIVQDLASEMKTLREELLPMLKPEKRDAFLLAFNNAVNRMGPAMKERLETARTRIARALNVKE